MTDVLIEYTKAAGKKKAGKRRRVGERLASAMITAGRAKAVVEKAPARKSKKKAKAAEPEAPADGQAHE